MVIVSICPLISVAIAAFRKKSSYKFIISVMLGLCVGSLCGDALLHLLPVVSLAFYHRHTHHHHHHHHRHYLRSVIEQHLLERTDSDVEDFWN